MNSRDEDIRDYDAVRQTDGSYIDKFGYITWYNKSGQRHKEDGPAFMMIRNPHLLSWWLDDKEYDSFDEWLIKLNKPDEIKMMLRLQYA
jgi:hypothetical protein